MTLLVLLSVPSLAATLTVDTSDATAYQTIQDAIDAAASGDTIDVAADTYEECLDTGGKDLTITGSSGSAATRLDGDGDCTSALVV